MRRKVYYTFDSKVRPSFAVMEFDGPLPGDHMASMERHLRKGGWDDATITSFQLLEDTTPANRMLGLLKELSARVGEIGIHGADTHCQVADVQDMIANFIEEMEWERKRTPSSWDARRA